MRTVNGLPGVNESSALSGAGAALEPVAAPALLPGRRSRSAWRKAAALVLAIAFLSAAGFTGQRLLGGASAPSRKPGEAPVPVTVATATVQTVPIEVHTVGNVQPYSVVNVVPQVGGQLTRVYFTQGQNVKKGDLLFEIDPRPAQAAVAQAEGNVERDAAQLQQAKANVARDTATVGQLQANLTKDQASAAYAALEAFRYKELAAQGAVSHEQADQMNTNAATARATLEADKEAILNAQAIVQADRAGVKTAEGTLAADRAAADTSRIQLGWTRIRSPIDGRTGSLNVYPGNVVAANSTTPLVTIDQVQPIYVSFTVPEQYLAELRQNMANHTLAVQAMIEGSKTDAVQGSVSFLDNTVNTSTGTVTLRAAFANADNRLFPGQFVDVVLTMPPGGPSVVVPATAVQTSQQGTAVYVVKGDNIVEFTPVQVLRTRGDLAAIGQGLSAGDVVVTDGQLQLTPGARIQIVSDRQSAPDDRT